jgi:hypothetical protein
VSTATARRSFLHLPDGWQKEGSTGFGPFVTSELIRRGDGSVVRWESRRYRKRRDHPQGSTWWAPTAIGWWIGVLFGLGSVCFALGALPGFAGAVGTRADDLTFFVGSIFFTTAAWLLYREVVTTDPDFAGTRRGRYGVVVVQLGRIDWWAAVIQLVGTLFFNVSTGRAYFGTFTDPTSANHAIWRPDLLGSICFLVSSWLSWAEICDGWWAWRPGQVSWWIGALNLAGSVAFGVSAVASRVQPNGDLRNIGLTNLGTFVGALGFLAGSVLLFPERTEGPDPVAPAGGSVVPATG